MSNKMRPEPGKFDWYRKARVVNVEEFHPPLSPRLEVDPKRLARKMSETGADVVHIAAASKHALYPTKHMLPHPELKGRDFFGEMIAACKKRGMRVIAYVPTCHKLPYDQVKKHYPEWIWRPAPEGRRVPRHHYEVLKQRHPEHDWDPTPEAVPPLTYHTSEGRHAPLCFNSPYRQSFGEMIREIVTGYPIDGILFDSWIPIYFAPFDICYCRKCRQDFKCRYGLELPVLARKLRPRQREAMLDWFSWYRELSWEVGEETIAYIRSVNDELLLLCHGEDPYAKRDHVMIHDGFGMEAYEPLAYRLQFLSLMINEGRICTPFIGRCDHLQRLITYQKDLFREGIATIAGGGTPIVANGHGFYFTKKKDMAPLTRLFDVMQEVETELVTSKPYPFLAIPVPRVTQSYSRGDAESRKVGATGEALADPLREEMLASDRHEYEGRWNEKVFWPYIKEGLLDGVKQQLEAAFRIGLSCHLPVQMIPEVFLDDLDSLRKYKILYLPGTPVLTANQVDTIGRYVKEGGNLIASGLASLYDSDADLLNNFALSEILGVNLRPATREEDKLLDNLRFKNGCYTDIYMKYVGKTGRNYFALDKLMPQEVRTKFLFVAPKDKTRVLANLVTADGRVVSPGITVSRYGRGKAVYLCPGYEQRYLRQRSPLVRDMFKNLFFHLVNGRVPLQVDLPDTVFTLLNTYEGGWLLHLINHTGCIHEKPFSSIWPLDLPRVEWTPTITDVTMRFRPENGVSLGRATAIPGRRRLPCNDSEEGVFSTSLAELHEYSCIRLPYVKDSRPSPKGGRRAKRK
ncbi:MAG: beta-galactosidase trimerization domain-containing protein [Lentisphaeria bacterium]|nr:beta-galactosidase trimerization domain-containing protein [Lentisphaeria bacterium]